MRLHGSLIYHSKTISYGLVLPLLCLVFLRIYRFLKTEKIHVGAGIISVLIAFISKSSKTSKPVLDLFGSSLIILSIEMSSILLK